MYWKGWSVLLIAGVGGTAQAISISGLYGTGVDDAGRLLGDTATDRHYSLVNSPVSGAARTPLSGTFPLNGPYWLPDQASSRWISPSGTLNNTAPAGTYVYKTSFFINDAALGGGSSSGGPSPEVMSGYRFRIWGRWTSDDIGLGVYINGHLIGGQNYDERPWATWAGFDTGFTSGIFRAGENTIEFRAENAVFAGRNPTGIQTQVHGAFQAVPEPFTGAVLGVGALAMLRRRRPKRA